MPLNFPFLRRHCCRVCANPFFPLCTCKHRHCDNSDNRGKKMHKCERILLVGRVTESKGRIIFTGQTSSRGSRDDSGLLCSSGGIHLSAVCCCLTYWPALLVFSTNNKLHVFFCPRSISSLPLCVLRLCPPNNRCSAKDRRPAVPASSPVGGGGTLNAGSLRSITGHNHGTMQIS